MPFTLNEYQELLKLKYVISTSKTHLWFWEVAEKKRSNGLLFWKATAEAAWLTAAGLARAPRASAVGWVRDSSGDWVEEEESVPGCIWPAPLSVTPGQTRPAPLTHSAPVLPHGTARLGSARTLTHTARTRNGDGREPEQPVHHGLPSRPLVTKKTFFSPTNSAQK